MREKRDVEGGKRHGAGMHCADAARWLKKDPGLTLFYNGENKVNRKIVFLVCLLGVVPAFPWTILVPTQSVSEFADTEVSTNIAIRTGRAVSREVEIHIQLAGTPTNCLEVAFGRDANANGVLDAEETETVYGWRAGRYFVENVRGWERIESEAAVNDQCNPPVAEGDQVGRMSEANEPRSGRKSPGVVDIQLKNNAEMVPKRFAATCGGETAFAELSTRPPPEWLFRDGWDMVRVTRRGAGVPSEWVSCTLDYKFFRMTLR